MISNSLINKQMKLSVFSCFILALTIQSQIIVIPLGPFFTAIPDPLSKSQERRATSVDRLMLPSVTTMATESALVSTLVVEYDNSLRIISPLLINHQVFTDVFLDACMVHIAKKSSFTANIPGLGKLATKIMLITEFRKNKIRTLKNELEALYETDNFMTEGERKIILLDIIDRALKIAI